jgi:hypothetical protein
MPLLNAGVRGAPIDDEVAAAIVRDAITRDRTSLAGGPSDCDTDGLPRQAPR